MREPGDNPTTEAEDEATEAAVLHHLLALQPSQATVAELVREIAGPGAGFAERDAVERAIRDLGGAGLINRSDEFVVPSRPALRFNQLLNR